MAPALHGPDAEAVSARLSADLGNLRAAFVWFTGQRDAASALRLTAALGSFWAGHGSYAEARAWIEQGLSLEGAPPEAEARTLTVLSEIVLRQGDLTRAAELAEHALILARITGDEILTARALVAAGASFGRLGDPDRADACHTEALGLNRAAGETRGVAEALSQMAINAWLQDDLAGFAALAEEALPLWRDVGDRIGIIAALDSLSLAARLQGNLDRQAVLVREMLMLSGRVADRFLLSSALWTAASIACERGEAVLAARFFGAEEVLREEAGFALDPAFAADHVRMVGEIRARLNENALTEAWSAGRHLIPAQAVAEAITLMDRLTSVARPVETPRLPETVTAHGLTRREVAVLTLVAIGLTDREIADQLFIARRTASKHIEAILAKLGATSPSTRSA